MNDKTLQIFYKTQTTFLFFSIIFTGCRASQRVSQNEAEPQTSEESFDIPAPNINLAKPLEISQKPEDRELSKKIDEIIEKASLPMRAGAFSPLV